MGKMHKSPKHIVAMVDGGFISPTAAKDISRAIAAKRPAQRNRPATQASDAPALLDIAAVRRLLVRRRALRLADILDRVDQPAKLDRNEGAILPAGSSLLARDFKGVVANRAIERICRDDVSQHELLECVDAVLQFLELVMRDFSHGSESSSVAGPANPTPASAPSHRLSETQE